MFNNISFIFYNILQLSVLYIRKKTLYTIVYNAITLEKRCY